MSGRDIGGAVAEGTPVAASCVPGRQKKSIALERLPMLVVSEEIILDET